MVYEDAVALPTFCEQLLIILEDAMIRFLGHCEELYSGCAARGLLDGAATSVKVLHGKDSRDVYAFLKADPLWTPVGGGAEDPSGGRTAIQASSFEVAAFSPSPVISRRGRKTTSKGGARDEVEVASTFSGSGMSFNPSAEIDELKQFLPQAFNDMSYTIGRNQLVLDTNKLVMLADLHTSLDWFVRKLRKLNGTADEVAADRQGQDARKKKKLAMHNPLLVAATSLTAAIPSSSVGTSESSLSKLKDKISTMATRFAAISEDALFTLRLEVKLQCVHYLSYCRKTLYCCDDSESTPDASVLELNRRLATLEELLAAHLQPHRLRFVLDGASATICSAMIGNVMAIQRVNRPGIRKLLRNVFAIQQNLSFIVSKKE
jgi:hypothetical protein